MKLRRVWCIHIAAFLVSVVILAVSAFSHYRAIRIDWTSVKDHTFIQIDFAKGKVIFLRWNQVDLWFREPFDYCLTQPFDINTTIDRICSRGVVSEYGLPDIAYWAKIGHDDSTVFSLAAVPLSFLLFFPLVWMCGFYLFKLGVASRRMSNASSHSG